MHQWHLMQTLTRLCQVPAHRCEMKREHHRSLESGANMRHIVWTTLIGVFLNRWLQTSKIYEDGL